MKINENEVIELYNFIWKYKDRKFVIDNGKITIEKDDKNKKEEFSKC